TRPDNLDWPRGGRSGGDDAPWTEEAEVPQRAADQERAGQEAASGPSAERAEILAPVLRPEIRPPCRASRHSVNSTGVPGWTRAPRRRASQFVNRTQPCDCVRPIFDGSGVP